MNIFYLIKMIKLGRLKYYLKRLTTVSITKSRGKIFIRE